jgi:DNA polymerase III subunit epsilon
MPALHAIVQAVGSEAYERGFVPGAIYQPSSGALPLEQHPISTAEFLVVDTETNGRSGEECELTEVGAVLVGGGELHERFESLVATSAPLSRGIQRFTGITQAMVDDAPPPESVLRALAQRLEGRVLVAHCAAFDRRVLRQAFARAELEWPRPPVMCTRALARRFAPLVREGRLAALAAALGIEVEVTHRALPDAETCARIFCALFPRLCAHAATVGEAVGMMGRRRGRRGAAPRPPARTRSVACPDLRDLPDEPGVYIFRNEAGQPLYVGKSVTMRTRARSHFADSSASKGWVEHARVVEYERTNSELGALVLENRLIKRLRPHGNVLLKKVDRFVYLRCRFDIPFPVLEIAREPAAGRAVTIGPLHSRSAALELVEHLNSLFGLRHCGRRLRLREYPSAYGQMGRCLSPCLNDLDPNLYRRRLDEALGVFGSEDGGAALIDHLTTRMHGAAAEQKFERAAWLRRRRTRLEVLLRRLGGTVRTLYGAPRLVAARHPRGGACDVFWLVGGRVVDWGAGVAGHELPPRTSAALRRADEQIGSLRADEVDEVRIVSTWLSTHDARQLPLDPEPSADRLAAFVADAAL